MNWMDRAVCASIGPGFDRLAHFEQRLICDVCPVRQDCAEFGAGCDEYSKRESGEIPLFGGMTLGEIRLVERAGRNLRRVAA